MSWKRAKFGSVLTQNRDGSTKPEPSLWMPPKMQILIPPDGQDHARPFIILEGHTPEQMFRLVLHESAIDGTFQGKTKRLVEL